MATPVFLPGKFYGQRRLEGYSPWGCKESDMTEHALTLVQKSWVTDIWRKALDSEWLRWSFHIRFCVTTWTRELVRLEMTGELYFHSISFYDESVDSRGFSHQKWHRGDIPSWVTPDNPQDWAGAAAGVGAGHWGPNVATWNVSPCLEQSVAEGKTFVDMTNNSERLYLHVSLFN